MGKVTFGDGDNDDEEIVPLNSVEIVQLRSLLDERNPKDKERQHRRPSLISNGPTNNDNRDDNDDDNENSRKESFSKKDFFLKQGLPPDTFSLLVFPIGKSWICAFLVFAIQITALGLLAGDVIDLKYSATNPLGVPPNVDTGVRACQFFAIIIAVLSQSDIIQSVHHFSFIVSTTKKKKTSIAIPISLWIRWTLSITLRIAEGFFSLVVTFILVMRADNVRDLLLDFTAVSFVSSLDNVVYTLGLWGFWGPKIQKHAEHITEQSLPTPVEDVSGGTSRSTSHRANALPTPSSAFSAVKHGNSNDDIGEVDALGSSSLSLQSNNSNYPRKPPCWRIFAWLKTPGAMLFLVWLPFIFGWLAIAKKQITGVFLCKTIYVQFGDDFSPDLETFSGLYDLELTGVGLDRRAQYIERRPNNIYDRSAKIAYCTNLRTWTFTYLDNGAAGSKSTIEQQDPCAFKAMSSESTAYDILDTASLQWYSVTGGIVVPLKYIHLHCFDCSIPSDDFCAPGQGTCVANRCVCNDGWYGLRCELPEPCKFLEVTLSPGFLNSRDWSDQFNETLRRSNGQEVSVYNRPVYINRDRDEFDIIFYAGWRWVMVYSAALFDYKNSSDIRAPSNKTKEDLAIYFSTEFHANYAHYFIGFLSEPVNTHTRLDTAMPTQVKWFAPLASTNGFETLESSTGMAMANLQSDIETGLFCAICNNSTNTCDNAGICRANGTCECPLGNGGTLCEVVPSGDGLCQPQFNLPGTQYDGGDCCLPSCVSTEQHGCGRNATEHYIGFPFCQDPKYTCEIPEETIWVEVDHIVQPKTSWDLVNDQTGEILLQGGPYDNTYIVWDGPNQNQVVEKTCMGITSCGSFTIHGDPGIDEDEFQGRIVIYWGFVKIATLADDFEFEKSFKFGQC